MTYFAIHSTRKGPDGKQYETTNATTPEQAQKLNADGFNIYQHMNTGTPGKQGRMTKAGVTGLCNQQVDIDPPEGMQPNSREWQQWKADRARTLAENGATDVLSSGRGVQGFWRYAEPVPVATDEDRERATVVNRALRWRFGGDGGAIDIARIMKVPGFTAWPNEVKAAAGWQPAAVERIGGTGQTAAQFQPFEQMALQGVPAKELAPKVKAAADINLMEDKAAPGYSGPSDNMELRDMICRDQLSPQALKLNMFLSGNVEALAAQYPGNDGKPYDASSADLAFASLLAFWTGCNPGRMVNIMMHSGMKRDKWQTHPDYLQWTIERAIGDKVETGEYLGGDRVDTDGTVRPGWEEIALKFMEQPHDFEAVRADVGKLSKADRELFIARTAAAAKAAPGGLTKAELTKAVHKSAKARRLANAPVELITNEDGDALPVFENARRLLTNDVHLKGCFRFNEFSQSVWVHREIPSDPQVAPNAIEPRPMEDADIYSVLSYLQSAWFGALQKGICADAINAAAHAAKYHPVRDYLNAQQWDGVPRLANLFQTYMPCKVEDEIAGFREYVQQAGIRFTVGAVARVMTPGCKVDTLPVLSGAQGMKKSTALRELCGAEWFGDDMPDVTSKDAKEWTQGIWIAEIAELASLNGKQAEDVKGFLSTQKDKFRAAYARVTESRPRQTVFAGTSNEDDYLRDPTGARRFWPLMIGDVCQIEAITVDRDQLWAEAVTLFGQGQRWWFDQGETVVLDGVQERHRAKDVAEDRVAEWLLTQSDFVLATQLADYLWPGDDGGRSKSMRASKYLKACGWQQDGRQTAAGARRWVRGPKAPQPQQMPAQPTNNMPRPSWVPAACQI